MPNLRGSLGCSASGITSTSIHGHRGSDDTRLVHGGRVRCLVQAVVRPPARDPPQPLAQALVGQFLAAAQLLLEDLLPELRIGLGRPVDFDVYEELHEIS
ncbi:hypothetical protein GCM10027176_69490 [Actinoallomurus bryophytorum]